MVDVCIVTPNPPSHPWGLARLGTLLAEGLKETGASTTLLHPPAVKMRKKLFRYLYFCALSVPKAHVYLISAHIISHFVVRLPASRTYVWVADFIPLRWGTISQRMLLKIEMLFMRCARLIGISEYTAQLAAQYFGINKIVGYVYPPLSPVFYPRRKREIERTKEKYHLPEEYLLHVGNTKPHKNVGALIEAAALIDTPLVKVGGDRQYVETLAKRYGAEVIFIPYVSDDELAAIYSGASVYVQPSLEEGFGYPVVEAAACGTPVVVSDRGPLPELMEIIDGGVVVPPTPRALVKGIESAWNISVDSAHVRKYFSPKNSAKKFLSLVELAHPDLK